MNTQEQTKGFGVAFGPQRGAAGQPTREQQDRTEREGLLRAHLLAYHAMKPDEVQSMELEQLAKQHEWEHACDNVCDSGPLGPEHELEDLPVR